MTAFMTQSAGVRIDLRVSHRIDLRELTMLLYHSNEVLGSTLTARATHKAIRDVLLSSGANVLVTIADYLNEEREEGSLVGSDVIERLEWARAHVLAAYRADWKGFPAELAAFEALDASEIV